MSECNCDFCRECREVRAEFFFRDPDKLIARVKSLRNRLCEAEDDANYYGSIMNGTWPNAVEILERALARAKASPPPAEGAVK